MDGSVVTGTGGANPPWGSGGMPGAGRDGGGGRAQPGTEKSGAQPHPCAESAIVPSAEGEGGAGALTLDFDGGRERGPGCRWLLRFSLAPMLTLVHDINTWAHSKAKLSAAAVNLTSLERGRMELRITGQGRDGRCRWCRTFRSGLRTAVRRDYGPQAFVLTGRCVFDAPPGEGGGAAPGPTPMIRPARRGVPPDGVPSGRRR